MPKPALPTDPAKPLEVTFCKGCQRELAAWVKVCPSCGRHQEFSPAVQQETRDRVLADAASPAQPTVTSEATRAGPTARQVNVAILLLAGVLAVLLVQVIRGPAGLVVSKWEYRVEAFDDYSWTPYGEPNVLGGEGWEIVAARRAGDTTIRYECIMKRRIP